MRRDEAIEQLAALICWLGFTAPREDLPDDYWSRISEDSKQEYRRDAQHFADAVNGHYWRLVPRDLDRNMIDAGMGCAAGLRSVAGLERLWDTLLETAPVYQSTPHK
jgi:hypothetical protein